MPLLTKGPPAWRTREYLLGVYKGINEKRARSQSLSRVREEVKGPNELTGAAEMASGHLSLTDTEDKRQVRSLPK